MSNGAHRTDGADAPKKTKVRRVFGRVRFNVKRECGEPETFIATMNKGGVTIRRLHGRKGQLLTFSDCLDALAHQFTLKL